MKLLLVAALTLFATGQMLASETDSLVPGKPKVEHEVFINTTFFIKQIVSLSNSNLEISPYIVGYKVFLGKHHGIRISAGGSFGNSKKFPDSTFVQIAKSTSVNYRVGYEYRCKLGKMWTFFTGFDFTNGFTYNSNRSNSATDILTTSDNTWSIGGGPMVGIQINVSKHISVFTETAFYYTYANTRSRTNSINFPELNVDRVSDIEQNGAFLLPTSLYFVFRF